MFLVITIQLRLVDVRMNAGWLPLRPMTSATPRLNWNRQRHDKGLEVTMAQMWLSKVEAILKVWRTSRVSSIKSKGRWL